MDIVLFGIQGSGKGTQGKEIARRYDMAVFETGAELRKLASEDSPLGKKVNDIISAGHLVSTETVMEILEHFFSKLPDATPVLIDGIPRSPEQKRAFDSLMQKFNRSFKGVLINIPKETAIERLLARKICGKCKSVYPAFYEKSNCEACGGELTKRNDDNETGIMNRLNAFENETLPVINEYIENGMMITVDGTQTIEAVSDSLFTQLDALTK